jgi:hypothetical protein
LKSGNTDRNSLFTGLHIGDISGSAKNMYLKTGLLFINVEFFCFILASGCNDASIWAFRFLKKSPTGKSGTFISIKVVKFETPLPLAQWHTICFCAQFFWIQRTVSSP